MTLLTLTGLINSLLPEPQAGLLNGILFGVKATLDVSLKNSLTNSGTLHIIALSGMNISILVSLVNLVLLRFVRRPIANMVTVASIIGFIWFVGPTPSVIRAAIMGVISLVAVSLGRQNWPILAWILAVASMLLLNPPWIGDLSFQLSVMATLGIILFGNERKAAEVGILAAVHPSRRLEAISNTDESKMLNNTTVFHPSLWEQLRMTVLAKVRLPAAFTSLIADDLRVTLAAQVFTVPIIFFQFHRIALVSPLSNILIGWLIAPIMVLGFATVFAGLLWLPLGTFLSWIVWVPLTYVIWVINWTAKLPFASISF
jgi:competence protein ComEC